MYYLGIDGGGSKTAFVLTDGQKNVVRETMGAPSNPVDVGIDTAIAVIGEGINLLLDGIPYDAVSVFAGIAGCMTGESRERIRAYLNTLGCAYADCGGDVQNVVAAGLGRRDGICTIMGTGSATFAQKDGELLRFGGYGYLLEEGGSGFSLGRDAVRAALEAEELSGEPTLIYWLLLDRLQAPSVLPILPDIYGGGKSYIASLSPLVLLAYEKGDAVATRILRDNMACVAKELSKARRALCSDRPVHTVLAGGLTARADLLLPLIKEQLDHPKMYDITALTQPPVMGAVILAKEKYHDQNRNEK